MSHLVNRLGRLLLSLLFLSFLLPFPLTLPAYAQAGIAMAGTFYQQEFELPQGTEIGGPSIYVIVFNHLAEELEVKMLFAAPFGVEVAFDKGDFPLPPGGEQKVYITVRVTKDAIPGNYDITVSAEASPMRGQGVKIATASAQKASLRVTGEADEVSARVVTSEGQPIKAQVRLFKVMQDRVNELAISETGALEARVSPGRFNVSAYIAGRKLGEETVEVRAGERKEVTLTVRTVFIEQFALDPNYNPDTKQIAFLRVVYTINNLYQPVSNVEVLLRVRRDEQPLEQVFLISLSRLEMGRSGGSYSYVPALGWQPGSYGLKLELHIEGKLYTDSDEERLLVTPPAPPPSPLTLRLRWIGAGIAVIIVAAGIFLVAQRRRKKPAQPR